MIASVTLTRGRAAHGARPGHRQAPAGDPELRQHRRALQRQDRHADGWRHAVRSARSIRRARRRRGRSRWRTSTASSRRVFAVRSTRRFLRRGGVDVAGYRKIDEIPFDFERRRLSVVVEPPDGAGRRLLIAKGAPEGVAGAVAPRSRSAGDVQAARRGGEGRSCADGHQRFERRRPSRRWPSRIDGWSRATAYSRADEVGSGAGRLRQLCRSRAAGRRRGARRAASRTASRSRS